MTYGSGNTPDYRLAEKMKSRFSGRGEAVRGMQASSTSELVRLAQMGKDPSVNCSELNFAAGVPRPARQTGTSAANPAAAPVRTSGTARPAQSRTAGTPSRTAGAEAHVQREYARPENVRKQNAASGEKRRSSDAEQRVQRTGTRPAPQKKTAPPESSAGRVRTAPQTQTKNANVEKTGAGKKNADGRTKTAGNSSSFVKKAETFFRKMKPDPVNADEIVELRVDTRRMTPMFAVWLAIGMMMIMSLVLSFSEIYQTTSEIAELENSLAALRDTAAELELELEEKNDIRVIEQIATEELGMVKEEAVQREYISLSDGERIAIIEEDLSETETPAAGLLLSSIWSSLGNLLDYFR